VADAQTKDIKDVIADAVKAYQVSNFEQAKLLFNTVLTTKQQVTAEQKVTAYTYLGAYWSLQSPTDKVVPKDSANTYFLAALDNDPFTNLDPNVFFGDEQAAFALAKTLIFRVGMEPMHPQNLNPNPAVRDTIPTTYNFRVVTTHVGTVNPRIRLAADPNANAKAEDLPPVRNDGISNIAWNGLINGVRADTGVYEILMTAVDNQGKRDSVKQRFRIEQVHAALEDTLPDFKDVAVAPSDTLKSRRSGSIPYTNGAKGLLVSLLAGSLPFITFPQTSRSTMSSWTSHMAIGAVLGIAAGAAGGFYANSHREDARAAAENTRRKQVRADFNAAVRAKNQERMSRTILVIRPLTVSGSGN
jgi:hypothetical protein